MRALTRGIPDSFAQALSAVPPDPPIDVELARAQHAAYRAALRACGVEVITLLPDEAFPDGCFVEDTAVIANGVALVTRPGAPSRRGETQSIARELATALELVHMSEPATLDGGDCMRLGDTIYVARSARTNAEGIAQLTAAFPRLRIVPIELPRNVLHLKCVCSPLGDDRMLLADESLDPSLFAARIVRVPAPETYAANAVAIGSHVIAAEGYPRTHEALVSAGFTVHAVPVSEVRKADGSLTCQSLIFAMLRV